MFHILGRVCERSVYRFIRLCSRARSKSVPRNALNAGTFNDSRTYYIRDCWPLYETRLYWAFFSFPWRSNNKLVWLWSDEFENLGSFKNWVLCPGPPLDYTAHWLISVFCLGYHCCYNTVFPMDEVMYLGRPNLRRTNLHEFVVS